MTGVAASSVMSESTPGDRQTAVFAVRGAAAAPLTWLLAASAVIATVPTVLDADVLRGPAAMNGSARGTALVMLAVGVPLLVGSMLTAMRGSVRALPMWLGAVAYLGYNGVMLLLATPFNLVFLAYDAVLGLSIWTALTLLYRVDVEAYQRWLLPGVRRGLIAGFLWVVVLLNALVWLKGIVAGMGQGWPPAFLDGTGLTTLPTYVQDLAFWLPAAAVAGWWLWRSRPYGHLVATTLLVYFTVEAIGIAADQTWGHQLDPESPVVSLQVVPAFVLLALICGVLASHLVRHVARVPRRPSAHVARASTRP
jgi:hypothetical protein